MLVAKLSTSNSHVFFQERNEGYLWKRLRDLYYSLVPFLSAKGRKGLVVNCDILFHPN